MSAVFAGLALAGKNVDPATQSFMTDSVYQIVCQVGSVIGGIVAIYGRITAKSSIGSSN